MEAPLKPNSNWLQQNRKSILSLSKEMASNIFDDCPPSFPPRKKNDPPLAWKTSEEKWTAILACVWAHDCLEQKLGLLELSKMIGKRTHLESIGDFFEVVEDLRNGGLIRLSDAPDLRPPWESEGESLTRIQFAETAFTFLSGVSHFSEVSKPQSTSGTQTNAKSSSLPELLFALGERLKMKNSRQNPIKFLSDETNTYPPQSIEALTTIAKTALKKLETFSHCLDGSEIENLETQIISISFYSRIIGENISVPDIAKRIAGEDSGKRLRVFRAIRHGCLSKEEMIEVNRFDNVHLSDSVLEDLLNRIEDYEQPIWKIPAIEQRMKSASLSGEETDDGFDLVFFGGN